MGVIQKIKNVLGVKKDSSRKNILTPKPKKKDKQKFVMKVFDPKIKKVLQGDQITEIEGGHEFEVKTNKTLAEVQKAYDDGKDNDGIEVLEHKANT
jgi:hypothetical protein